jgi:hypothetical protein
VARLIDLYPDLTDTRLSLLAGIYAATWRDVIARRSPLSMPVAVGMSRYCEAYQAYVFAARAHPWLEVFCKQMYYHLRVGEAVLRVDRLDGGLFAAEPLGAPRRGDLANLWLAGVPNDRCPYLRLEVDGRADEMFATLRLLSDAAQANDGATEHDRWDVEVPNVPLSEIHAWAALPQTRPELRITTDVDERTVPDLAEPPPAAFELRRVDDHEDIEDERR